MTHPFVAGLRAPLHVSHRGGSKVAPENTLVAFRQALQRWHTDVLELDVHLSRDGEVVVSHDDTVDRCTDGTGAIAQLDWATLQQLDAGYRFTRGEAYPYRGQGVKLPRLVEVLREFPHTRLNIELKTDGVVEAFAELVRTEAAVPRLCVGSEFDATAGRLHQALPDACHFYPRDALAGFVLGLRAFGEPADDGRFTVLDMPLVWEGERLFDQALRAEVERRGKWVNVWTIDDPAEMRRCFDEGVGGVMTDRPDLLREVIGARG